MAEPEKKMDAPSPGSQKATPGVVVNAQAAPVVDNLLRPSDTSGLRKRIYDHTFEAIQNLQPIANSRYSLHIENPRWVDPETWSPAHQKKVFYQGGTLARRIQGDYVLKDLASDKEVSRKRATIAAVPHLNDRGLFLLNGSHWHLGSQTRLDPGVYPKIQENGEFKAMVNPNGGRQHSLTLDPESGVFHFEIGSSRIPLMSVLRSLGVDNKRFHDEWGRELVEKNAAKADPSAVRKLIDKLYEGSKIPEGLRDDELLTKKFSSMKFDPYVTKQTIGHAHENYDVESMLQTAKRLLALSRGETSPSERDHQAFQRVLGQEHLFAERAKNSRPILNQILWKATHKGNLDSLPSGLLNQHLAETITATGLGVNAQMTNPAEMLDAAYRVSKMGKGGIRTLDAVPDETRNVHSSQFYFVDPIVTPESGKIGVDSRFSAATARDKQGRVYSQMYNHDGSPRWVTARDIKGLTIAPWESRNSKSDWVEAIHDGEMTMVPRNKVDVFSPPTEMAFSPVANMVPFKSASPAHRTAMGARMITQALPLVNAESPYVQSGSPMGGSFEQHYGKHFGAIKAEQAGRVMSVGPDSIKVKYMNGETADIDLHKYELYDHAPGRKTHFTQTPTVKPGDFFKPDQLLARSNYTDNEGRVALGLNARTAWLPARGGSVTPDTHTLWYIDGQPRFGPIGLVEARDGLAVASLDRDSLATTIKPATGFIAHHSDTVVQLQLHSGRKLRATNDHSFIVLNHAGELVEAKTTSLTAGSTWLPRLEKIDLPVTVNTVLIQRKRFRFEVPLDADFGFLCGLYVAEGSPCKATAEFACSDPQLQLIIQSLLRKYFPGVTVSCKQTCVRAFNHAVAKWFETECGKGARNKKVPDFVFGSPEEFRKGFLSGFWTGDGRVSSKEVSTDTDALITSRRLRDGLGLLCSSLGISTTHGEYPPVKPNHGRVYRLAIAGRSLHKLPKLKKPLKERRLQAIRKSYEGKLSNDFIPLFLEVQDKFRLLIGEVKDKAVRDLAVYHWKTGKADRQFVLNNVPQDTSDTALSRLLQIAQSDVIWDRIESITPDGYKGFVYDFEVAPSQTFVCLDNLVVHNSNFEDAFAVSESFAKRMTSDHMALHSAEEPGMKFGKTNFRSLFPSAYTPEQLKNLDDNGVIKPGTIVKPGQPLVLATRESKMPRTTLVRSPKPIQQDVSEMWDHDYPGEVVDVVKTKGGYRVSVKSAVPMQDSDKVSGRHGNKGIVTIVPDHQMPIGEDGKPFEVLVSPYSLPSRKNTSQIAELLLGKIAHKHGKKYELPDFHEDDLRQYVANELQKHGMKATESITDPVTGTKIPGVLTGNQFLMKLHHLVETKIKQRDTGSYDSFGSPARGGSDGAKRMSQADTFALLAHRAEAFLRGTQLVRGQRNEQWWEAVLSGHTPPTPGVSNQYRRMIEGLRASGIHPVQENGKLRLTALTDKDVDNFAGDREIKNPGGLDWSKDGEPVPGGLFDKGLHGEDGSRWSKLTLHTPMPNPAFEDAIRYTLGLTEKQMRSVLAGTSGLLGRKHYDPAASTDPIPRNYATGPQAIHDALRSIDLPKEMAQAVAAIQGTKKTKRDEAIRRYKFLKGAQDQKLHPADWMLKAVPILPPNLRPVSKLEGSNTELVSDPNYLYQDLFHANKNLRDLSSRTRDVAEERLALYDAMKAVTGLGDPINPKHQQKGVKGIMKMILGESPKWSLPQHKLLSTPVDLVGRSTVGPDSSLDMDEVGIPEKMAFTVYKRFVERRLVRNGMNPVEAVRSVREQAPEAKRALLQEMEVRPVSYHRAPVLHKYGHIGGWPKLVKGDVIKVSPFVIKGLGMDFDGDTANIHVPVYDKEIEDVRERMMPSKNLLSAKDFQVHYKPEREFHVGLWQATHGQPRESDRERVFDDINAVRRAFAKGEISAHDKVTIMKH